MMDSKSARPHADKAKRVGEVSRKAEIPHQNKMMSPSANKMLSPSNNKRA